MLLETNTTSGGDVAVLDSAWVVGTATGTGTLWVWAGDLMTSIPVTVTDTRHAWAGVATGETEMVRDAWGSGPSDVFAATHTGMLRYDGVAWQHAAPVRWRSLHDVHGQSAASAWAVGDDGILVRWNGAAWSGFRFDGTAVAPHVLTDFTPPARRIALRGVHTLAPSTVVAVGDSGTVLTFNGATWSVSSAGTTAALTHVWGTAANNLYATTAAGTLLRFNGTAWAAVAGVQAPGSMHAVWGTAANNVYAVGDGGLLYRYNGTTWTRTRLPTRVPLYAVWGSGAGNVFVAGAGGVIYRWNGAAWTPEKLAGAGSQILGLWGTGTTVYATGAGGVARR